MNQHPGVEATGVRRAEPSRAYRRAYDGSRLRRRSVELAGGSRVNLLESGFGPPVVCLHGTGSSAPFLSPLLRRLDGFRVIAPDRPGQGLSDPVDLPRHGYRAAAVGWLDRLFDTLDVVPAALVGDSMGGVWALWYALDRPGRLRRLVLIAAPALPGTCAPLPYRLLATPGLGDLLARIPPTEASVRRFAGFMGERAAIDEHPELIDLLVAHGRDPVAAMVDRREVRVIVSPLALLSASGFRARTRLRRSELGRLSVPTLLVWGRHDPVGRVATVSAVAELIARGRLAAVPGGHAPWLGHPEPTASAISRFV